MALGPGPNGKGVFPQGGKGVYALLPKPSQSPSTISESDAKTAEVGSTEVGSTGVGSIGVGSIGVGSIGVGSTEVPTSKPPIVIGKYTIDPATIKEVKSSTRGTKPTVTTWSKLSVIVLKSLQLTIPTYSMSDEIRDILEKGLEDKYPELVKRVKEEIMDE